ncbi:MAG TPA: RsmE family RNA methyltransferase, partial [Elusimicrobiales bacterium]|nr:RsmE family RNA methyltransferase [Elusimicrobiales bacterium]
MSQHYLPPGSVKDGRFLLKGDAAEHISRVLRARPGDTIRVFDGAGGRFLAELEEVSRSSVAGRVTGPLPWSPPAFRTVVCHAVTARAALEETLRRATEAGAAEFRPFVSERSQPGRIDEEWERRRERYDGIILSAAEQCERGDLSRVLPPARLEELLELPGRKFFGAPGEGARPLTELAAGLAAGAEVMVFIGPEGGFSPAELELAERKGAEFFTLGPTVLRAENAAAAAAAVLACAGEALKKE